MIATQELSQLARIDSITLTTVFQQGILARIGEAQERGVKTLALSAALGS
jgi:hypothetical protein